MVEHSAVNRGVVGSSPTRGVFLLSEKGVIMKHILCFGDSNTFGTIPLGGRWGIHERWPGVLQDLLGLDYRIIEEGLGGRTTMMEDELEGDKNGRRHLPMLLHSHRPLDMVIIMLGTNDMKHRFNLLPADIAAGAAELCRLAENYEYGPDYPVPRIFLISPILIGEGIEHSFYGGFTEAAVDVSRQLAGYYKEQARAHGWLFLDAATVAKPSERDKLHMEAADHKALAEAVSRVILA